MRRTVSAALAAMLTAAVVAGCGSNDSGSTASTPATSSAAAKAPAANAPKGEPIVIGNVCSCTGAQQGSLKQTSKVIEGWAAWKNAMGGINGHPVKVISVDDNSNATKAAGLVRKLVEQDKVQAIVGEQSLVDQTWAKYVQQKGIPVIGAASYSVAYLTEPGFYTTGAQTPALAYGLVDQAKKAGKSKIGVLPCAEAASCSQFAPLLKGMSSIIGGIGVVYEAKIAATAPSYTATCLAARGKGVDAAVIVDSADIVLRVANQCAQQGFKPLQLNISATAGPTWAGQASMEGTITTQPQVPLADQSTPATKAFHEGLDQYASGVSKAKEYNESNLWTWSAGEAFALAAERAKLTPTSTGADVVKGLLTFKDETVGGLTPPLTFAKSGPASPLIPCYFLSTIKDQKFTAPNGTKPTCLSAGETKKLGALLAASSGR